MRKALPCVVLLTTLLTAGVAHADVIKYSDKLENLNNQAVKARDEGNYQKAETLFQAILELHDIDLFWMQLGNIYSEQNLCLKAEEAFSHVKGAENTIEGFTHKKVLGLLEEKRRLLNDKCTAKIVFQCPDSNTTITIDDDLPIQCSSDPVPTTPAIHRITATTESGDKYNDVQTFARQTTPVDVSAFSPKIVKSVDESVSSTTIEPQETDASNNNLESSKSSAVYKIVGGTLIGVGAAAAIGGGVLYGVSKSQYDDVLKKYNEDPMAVSIESEKSKTNNKYYASYALIGAGGAMVVTGITLLVVDAVKSKSSDESAVIFSPYFSQDNVGFGVTYNF